MDTIKHILYNVSTIIKRILGRFKEAVQDLLPVLVVVLFFQLLVIRQPFPNLMEVLIGTLLVIIGLMLFVQGLEISLFPIGENMAHALAKKGSLFWLLLFAFALGFSTTIAEPALIAVTNEAARVAAAGELIEQTDSAMRSYAKGVRISVAISVGCAILLGVLRIIYGWPLHVLIISGYVIVMLMTLVAPDEIIGLAYDAGGVTTSTITVPLVTALGVGLATVIKGRNPMTDGFGLIAFASVMPMIFVMGYGMFVLK